MRDTHLEILECWDITATFYPKIFQSKILFIILSVLYFDTYILIYIIFIYIIF